MSHSSPALIPTAVLVSMITRLPRDSADSKVVGIDTPTGQYAPGGWWRTALRNPQKRTPLPHGHQFARWSAIRSEAGLLEVYDEFLRAGSIRSRASLLEIGQGGSRVV